MKSGNNWKILFVLGVIGLVFTVVAKDKWSVCAVMALAYMNNVSYSTVSRSAVRDSATYHALMLLVNNVLWYVLIRELVLDNMTLALFLPYTVATVYGSFSGAVASMRVENFFGITTSTERKTPSPGSVLAQKILLGVLAVSAIIGAIFSNNILASFTIAGLVFVNSVAFSLLRRSRNTSNTTYHIIASLVNSAVWYALYQHLTLSGMTFALFLPYCAGSVLGGLAGQDVSARVERRIGASADAHLSSDSSNFVPWRSIGVLILVIAPFIFLGAHRSWLIELVPLSAAQQISFSLVSRSRNRNNMTYHVIASVFSNSIWFLTFRELQIKDWTPDLYVPYAVGGAMGSVTGVGISMGIERQLKIDSGS